MENQANYLKNMVEAGTAFKIILGPSLIIGLQWGEGKRARERGFAKKEVIECLNWAEKNAKEAFNIMGLRGIKTENLKK